jgi:hypothetical protein
MPRELPSGTPTRASGYLRPGARRRPVAIGLAVAAALLAVCAIVFMAGHRAVASPGRLSAGHAPIDQRCAECHRVGHAVVDLRCERCHEPGGTHRLTQASHAGRGIGITAQAHAGENIPCATCHAEHRGGMDLVQSVDDGTCVRCHQFPSLASHPEFAAVSVGKATGIGLKFTHDRHLVEVSHEGRRCEACHQLSGDLSGFEPIDFDRHCARCHTTDGFVTGDTDPLDGRLLSSAPAAAPVVTPGARTLVTVSRMAHRDEWVLNNLLRLRRIADPDGERTERLALQTQIAELSNRVQIQPVAALPLADLERLRDALARDLAAPAQNAAVPNHDERSLADMTAALDAVARTLGAARPAPAPDQADATSSAAPSSETAEDVRTHVEARKAELLSALDAVAARGNPALTARAADLRKRVTAVAPGSAASATDIDALRGRLRGLDAILRSIGGVPDQQAAADAAGVAALRDATAQQIGGALSVEQFEARRTELLRVLDAVSRQNNPALQARIAPLRQRVLMLRAGETPEQRRVRTQEMLSRVTLEIELAKSGETAAPSAIAAERDRLAAQSRLAVLTRRLADLTRPVGLAARTPASPDEALGAITSLAAPCLKCHVMDGARLAPVAATQRVFRGARFTHKPHVQQTDCLTCHGAVQTSRQATDLVVPAVASCQSCHAPSKAPSRCTTCHTYHPPAADVVER